MRRTPFFSLSLKWGRSNDRTRVKTVAANLLRVPVLCRYWAPVPTASGGAVGVLPVLPPPQLRPLPCKNWASQRFRQVSGTRSMLPVNSRAVLSLYPTSLRGPRSRLRPKHALVLQVSCQEALGTSERVISPCHTCCQALATHQTAVKILPICYFHWRIW